ncbi:T9SS type A sorting domain-containing protein [Lacibacter sp. H407]|uniref:T9SS type A sorting domain-containing protein n=1 Tax=Lacibacter sp. H407 TaxID=3133423 RepID=UPI0030BE7AE7
MKTLFGVLIFIFVGVAARGQVMLTNAAPSVTIDFSNSTVASIGSNPQTAFTGVGFGPNPSTTGQLNSNAWSIIGWDNGSLFFGGSQVTAATDFTRGAVSGPVSTGGIYAFTGAPHSASNPCLMLQPGGSDFAPGAIILRIQNNGTSPIAELTVFYNLFVRNDEGRSSSFNFSYSSNNINYSEVPELGYETPEAADANGWVKVEGNPSRSTIIKGLGILPGDYFYIRWNSEDISGAGSRDEIGLDDVGIAALYNTNTITLTSLSSTTYNLANCFTTATGSLNFTATGIYNSSNIYTVQLSNAAGSFTSPVNIGSLNGNALSETINFTIPAGTFSGTGYQMRIVSTDYVTFSNNSSPVTISQAGSCVSTTGSYFRSRQSGNWNDVSTWESSTDNSNWITATLAPTNAANVIRIRNGHTVTISSNVSADQLVVDAGAVLKHLNGNSLSLSNGGGDDMIINGTYVLYGTRPALASGSTVSVEESGLVRVDGNSSPSQSDDFAFESNEVIFKTNAVFQWNLNAISFQTSGITYFKTVLDYKPIFRISGSVAVGGATQTLINGVIEVTSGKNCSFQNAGAKIFRDGIVGAGTITQLASSGPLQISGNDGAQLGGAGTINLHTAGLQINVGAQVFLTANKTINNSVFTNNGILNCQNFIVSGSTSFVNALGATLGIGSADGITTGAAGNIQTTGVRTFDPNATYVYNGTTNQVTGNALPATAQVLSISSFGASGNNTVSLTNNNTTVNRLNLNSGYFEAGLDGNLNIADGGIITGGNGAQPNEAKAGTITFLGAGITEGISNYKPLLYAVIIRGGVDFNGLLETGSAKIINRLQINTGGFIANDAPFYETGSTLIYNTGTISRYGRGIEWGNTVGLQGYPHHIVVQNSILDLFNSDFPASELEIGGNLIIGNANGRGEVHMNSSMYKPLSVLGNVIIGSDGATSSVLQLSSNLGGDLWLGGSFTRYNNSSFNQNNRAVYLKGSSNTTISTPGVSTPGISSQDFNYLRLQKTGGASVSLGCTIGITHELTFDSGYIVSSSNNVLIFYDEAKALEAKSTSFTNGPVKKIGNDAFVFPVGKPALSGPAGGGYRFVSISAPSQTTDAFTAEFMVASATSLGPIGIAGITRVSRCEYWKLDRTSGSSSVDVTLSWNARSNCNVSYVSNLPSLSIAHFNGSVWDSFGGKGATSPESTVIEGSITWAGVATFSPFSLASTDVTENILPLPLSSFTARTRKTDIAVDWMLTNNNDYDEFMLERSKDGVRFETLKTVKTKVVLNTAAYAEVDSNPFTGWNYYRLRAINKIGRENISQVVKVWFGREDVIRITPNPASEKILINFAAPSSISQIELVNIAGQVLQRIQTITFNTEINIAHLQAGMYVLRIKGKNGLSTKSFIKQ